jgi:hypothetical protein
VSPYEQAFNRIRAEYVEMPGMQLTAEQVGRLSGVSVSVCRLVLDDLVRAGFLSVGANGGYARPTGLGPVSSRSPGADANKPPIVSMPVHTR